MKALYTITLTGCDGNTYIKIILNDSQVKFVERLCKLSKEISTYPCEPIMTIKEIKE